MNQSIAQAHVRKETVTNTLALARALGQTRNVHQVQIGIYQLIGLNKCVDLGKTVIRHSAHANVGFVRAVRKLRNCRLRIRDAVEHRCFTGIGQTYYAAFQAHIV